MPLLAKGKFKSLFHILFSNALYFIRVNLSYSRAFLAKVGRMKLALWISAL